MSYLLSAEALPQFNALLAQKTAKERIEWVVAHQAEHNIGPAILSSSFGIQAAVTLHLVTQIIPNIPVVLIDTGYLFPETYRFIDRLHAQLNLNLKVYRADLSPAWQEARYGKRYEQDLAGLEAYNLENKVLPMRRALTDLNADIWFTGLRRVQSSTRTHLDILSITQPVGSTTTILKCAPIVDWSEQRVYEYLQKNGLSYHPLWEEGYVSLGDTHSTRKLLEGMTEEDTRFNGLKRE